MDTDENSVREIQIPQLNSNLNQILSDAILKSPGFRKLQEEAKQKQLEKRRHLTIVIITIAMGLAGAAVGLLSWLFPR